MLLLVNAHAANQVFRGVVCCGKSFHGHHDTKRCQQQQPDKRKCPTQSVAPPQSLAHRLHVGIAPLGILAGAFGCNTAVTVWKNLTKQQAKRVNVSTPINCILATLLLWRHIFVGAGGLFQNGIVIGIGETEVDDLHVVAVAGDEDIARLQVAVHNLLAVDVGQGVNKLVYHLATGFFGWIAFQKGVESHPVDIFHHDTGTEFVVHLLGEGLHDVRVVELCRQIKLFLQQFDIGLQVAVLGFQPFQDELLALSAHLHHLVETPQ